MQRLLQTFALIAALAVLVFSLWQDWGLIITVKRLVVAYLGFLFLGNVAALAVRAGSLYDRPSPANGAAQKHGGDEA